MATEEELLGVVESKKASERLFDALTTIDDLARSVASGATFGFADEIAAGLATLTGVGAQKGDPDAPVELQKLRDRLLREQGGTEFERNLAAERARDRSIDPALRVGGELAGALATAPVTAPLALGAAARVVPGASRAAGIGRGAVAGALEGGIAGAGTAEGGVEERLAGAGLGAATGGAVAPAAELVVRGGQAVGRAIGRAPRQRAADAVNQAIQRDGANLQQAAARIERRGEGTVLADVAGENVRGLTRAAASVPGPAKQRITRSLEGRVTGQAARMRQGIAESIASDDFVGTFDDIVRRRRELASPLYEAAFEAGDIGDDALRVFIGKAGPVKKAIREAKRLPQFADLEDTDIRVLDQAYKVVGDQAMAAARAGRNSRAFNAHELRAMFRDMLTERVPAYDEALQAFAGESAAKDALTLGRQFVRTDVDELPRIMQQLSESEKEMFRIGAARELRQMIDRTPDSANLIRRLAGTPEIRQKLRSLFDSDSDFRRFSTMLTIHAQQAATRNAVLSGSRTTPLREEIEDLGAIPGLAAEVSRDFLLGGARGAGTGLLARGARALSRPSDATLSEIADITVGPGGAGTLQRVGELEARDVARRRSGQRAGAIGLATGRTAGAEAAR